MKFASLILLFGSLAMSGCSGPPAGQAGDADDPALTTDLEPIDEAAEAAANSGGEY